MTQDTRGQAQASGTVGVPTGPEQIRPGCWMVGRRNPLSLLQCNTYLRVFEHGKSPRRVCVDPGSQLDFPQIEANLCQLVGELREIDALTLNHQDPDVVGNSPRFCDANPDVTVTATEEVWRLVQHLGFRPGRLEFANPARAPRAIGSDNGRWLLIATPFCHFRGAMAFYDPELRTLFSGDLFGGFNLLGRVQVLAELDDWAGVAQFHQIYMPMREVLRYAVRQIRTLRPPVEVIAPQHGHVIAGDLVHLFLERMHELLVGNDLLAVNLDDAYLQGYREVLANLLARAQGIMGKKEVIELLKTVFIRDDLHRIVHIDGEEVRLLSEGYSAIVKVLARLTMGMPLEVANELRGVVLSACSARGLPIPPIGAGLEGVG